jgi:hypothetical protein
LVRVHTHMKILKPMCVNWYLEPSFISLIFLLIHSLVFILVYNNKKEAPSFWDQVYFYHLSSCSFTNINIINPMFNMSKRSFLFLFYLHCHHERRPFVVMSCKSRPKSQKKSRAKWVCCFCCVSDPDLIGKLFLRAKSRPTVETERKKKKYIRFLFCCL